MKNVKKQNLTNSQKCVEENGNEIKEKMVRKIEKKKIRTKYE